MNSLQTSDYTGDFWPYDNYFYYPFYPYYNIYPYNIKWYTCTNVNYPQIKETDIGYLLRYEIAGFSKEEIKIEVENRLLLVSASKKVKDDSWQALDDYSNQITLPDYVNINKTNAKLKDGILIIAFQKIKEENSKLQIQIK